VLSTAITPWLKAGHTLLAFDFAEAGQQGQLLLIGAVVSVQLDRLGDRESPGEKAYAAANKRAVGFV
jgi:hypothetical protein